MFVTCQISAVDLFCGAGGLTRGLEAAGVSVEAGIDDRELCRHAYETNNEAVFRCEDIQAIAAEEPELVADLFDDGADATLLAGCPPCQPFSTLTNGATNSDHSKYHLLTSFWDIVDFVRPDVVLMENVQGVHRSEIYRAFEQEMDAAGYNLNPRSDRSVYCPEYGVPQTRTRWVTFAAKEGVPDLGSPVRENPTDHPTASESIDHLPALEAGETDPADSLHSARELEETNIERVRHSQPGGTWRDWPQELVLDCHTKDSGRSYESVYGRMRPDEPAPTITTQFYNLGSGRFGHYDTEQDRALSLREGALLQTFPGGYSFFDELGDVGIRETGKLIGNAVPPRLAEVIGRRTFEIVEETDRQTALGRY
jgi:DNA (cytosine-5)-methyltransferase 1